MSKEIARKLADVETGELINIYEGDTLQIISEEQKKAVQKSYRTIELNEEIKEWNEQMGGFVFVLFQYEDKLFKRYPELKEEDITKLFYLGTYVDYGGYIIYKDKPMSKMIMQRLIDLNRQRFNIFLSKMINLNIIICVKKDVYMINKNIFTKGELESVTKSNYDYTRLYINTIRNLYENVSIRKHGQLGKYFKMIPYIHRQGNVLCWNPESKYEDIALMNVKELKNILGYHEKSIKRFIEDMLSVTLENNESIVGFFRSKINEGESYIIVNHNVFYGGNFDLPEKSYSISKWFKQ